MKSSAPITEAQENDTEELPLSVSGEKVKEARASGSSSDTVLDVEKPENDAFDPENCALPGRVVRQEVPSKRKIEAFEIDKEEGDLESNNTQAHLVVESCLSHDEEDDDLKGLLSSNNDLTRKEIAVSASATATLSCCCSLEPSEKVGNMTIFLPSLYYKTGWGISGPHWFGPPCVFSIICAASFHLVRSSLAEKRPCTAGICCFFAILSAFYLLNTAYRDPGLIRARVEAPTRDYLWCDFCKNYQPPGGAHCPQCNVCISGFDHHCVWMGSCIGRNNLRSFLRFNLSWLAYLIYAIVWVGIMVPLLRHGDGKNIANEGNSTSVDG